LKILVQKIHQACPCVNGTNDAVGDSEQRRCNTLIGEVLVRSGRIPHS
jgi:hypothetical protein